MKVYIFTFLIIKCNNDFFLNNFQAKQCKIIGKNIWENSLLTYVLSLKLKSGFSIKIKALQVYCEIFTAVIIA